MSQIEDGTYSGSYDNSLGSAAEVITDTVVQHQSVEIDAISGATMSSKTILKAVENAL